MNEKTKIKYELAKMYEYVSDIDDICKRYNYDYDVIKEDKLSYNASLMLIIQLGERAAHIREIDRKFYDECPMKLRDVVLMRNRVTHGYTSIDKELFVNALKNDIVFFKEYIEQNVIKDVLYDPYQLYEKEYDDILLENQLLDFPSNINEMIKEAKAKVGEINKTNQHHKLKDQER